MRVTPLGIFSAMNVELFNTDIDHLMDNRTLRMEVTAMATPTSSDTYGGRIIGTIGSDMMVLITNTILKMQNKLWDGNSKYIFMARCRN